jgi:predicted MFS family arabinose efflux permease
MERAKKGNQGEFMAYYSIAFSIAHIFGHNSGLQMINAIGFDATWNIITGISVVGLVFLFVLMRMIKKEKQTG